MKITRTCEGRTFELYQDGYLNELLMGFRDAVENHNTSAFIVIDGRSGYGKTTLGNSVGITLDENFGINKIYYSPQKFIEGLANAKAGDCLMFDEAMLISNRSVMSQVNKMITMAMSMIRSKNLFIIFCINSIFDLDKNLAISRADALLHVYGETLIDRGRFGAFFRGKDGKDRLKGLYLHGKKWYDYSYPKANFVGKFTKEFVVNEQEYEKRKQEGVNEFLMNKPTERQTRAFSTRNKLIKHLLDNEIMTSPEIQKVTGLSSPEVSYIKNEHGRNNN